MTDSPRPTVEELRKAARTAFFNALPKFFAPDDPKIMQAAVAIDALADRLEEAERADDPQWDATDGAHPAWWRGNDAGVASCAAIIKRLASGEDAGYGTSREPWEGARQSVLALRERVAALERENVELRKR